ncbi:acylphosphatase [Robertmurraya sp. DFI.2.37]|uniref:acylphosphatase n=1 Tax=Robertmurraya sp. DFI.2.37 TaxID=3031819 RepID=UPI001244DEAC|nr:acylphosphatase [Robertmurraya sp. DFI.2.37]MDF1509620.1 acylphosphatase [Robertmurraya sp. DFI.2.37]
MVRLHITVSGSVQGVGYRYFAQMKASQFGITGWVRNLSEGGVEIVAVGDKENLEQFMDSLREGNPFSKVTDISFVELEDTEPFHSFKIKY